MVSRSTPVRVVLVVAWLVVGSALPAGARSDDAKAIDGSRAIFVRRTLEPEPGVAVFAVAPDGSEAQIRHVPDSVVPGTVSAWGTVSAAGWLALGVDHAGGEWPMVIVDLRDPAAEPWVIEEANLGGIGPRWGPMGLIAAVSDDWSTLVVADPETHTTRLMSMQGHGLVGGGPSIVWTADGRGIVGSKDGRHRIIRIDGGKPLPEVAGVFDPGGRFGAGLSGLRVCEPVGGCGRDGDVLRIGESTETIWSQEGRDRALAAGFGQGPGEYWLSVDHDGGRQVAIVHLDQGERRTIAILNRRADWQYVGHPEAAADGSMIAVRIDIGAKPAAALVSLDGGQQSLHSGAFAGFVDQLESFADATYAAPAEAMPATGERYALPSVKELIAEELARNPGRRVLGKASHDAVEGDTAIHSTTIHRDRGEAEAYLDCIGPSSVTVTSGSESMTSPCLSAGGYAIRVERRGPIIVNASGDTSWRVVVYSS